jgi:chromosome segregation ATPase
MATATGKSRCATCDKGNAILKCGGCTQDFCYNHFGDHRQQLNTQLGEVEVNRDLFRQTLSEQTAEPQKHSLIKQIDQWERDSIKKIRQATEEARQTLLQHTNTHIKHIEVKLNKLTDQLRQGREENDFVETDLRHWNEQLTQLTNELNKQSNISLRHDSKPFVTKLYVEIAIRKYACC